MKKALVLMTCLCMLVSMMTGITVGAAWDLMYYPVETESVIATSWKTAIDNGKYTAEDGTQKTYDLNGVADATLRYITPGANGTAGAIELAMVPNETVEDKKSDGTTVTRGPDYRPRILTNHMITLRTGNTYKISVYVKGNLSGTNDVNLWLNSGDKVTFDTDSSTPPAYRDVFKVRVTDQWQYVEKEFKVKEITDGSGNVKDSSSLTLGMRPMTNFPSGSFQVDELKVELTNKVASATNTVFTNGIGDGSVIDPYEITTVADIKKMAELVKEGYGYQTAHYILMNDIDMSGVEDFVGIATGTDTRNAFKGTFDGNYHVIKNMSITDSTNARGFFFAMYGATIKNLGFENAYIEGSAKIGVLAAAEGGSTITNCYVRKATLKQVYGGTWADNNMAAFVGCSVDMGNRGGLITDHTVFNNCYSTDITTIGYNGTEVTVGGGFKGTGYMNTMPYTTLNNCYTDCGQFSSKGYQSKAEDPKYYTDDEKIAAGVLVVNNSYKSATVADVTASKLSDAFIDSKATYNYGLPVLAWEKDKLDAAPDNTIFTNGMGNGTENRPYQITNVADLKKMAELVVENSSYQTAHYKLMNDIDMTGVTDFMGIATGPDTRNAFKGTFDGNNHVIKNMRIEETTTNTRGFFYAMYGATIKNLGFENAYVSGFKTGVLAGSDGGSTIENCFVRNATLKNLYQHTDGYMGAFVGCVTDMGSSRGGLITDHTVFTNCYATGIKTIGYKDTEVAVGGAFKGGRIWHTETYVTLNNCYTDYGQFAATGYKNANDDTPTDYPTDDEKIAAGTLVVNNSYKSATPSTVTASALGSAFIANKTEYNNGLPVLAWEADRLPEVEEPTMYTVSVTVGENGSVTKDGEPVPASFEVEEGSAVTLTLVPDDKYVAKAKVNGADYTVTNNQITLTVTEATIVAVTFERIPDVTPGFAGDSTSYSWFKTVDGKATIFTYHKLADFNTGETDLEYGVKLWNNAKPEDKVTLPAYDSATEQPAKAVPGAMFAIRVYGSAITADQTYTILPYIGTETGSETTPDYE